MIVQHPYIIMSKVINIVLSITNKSTLKVIAKTVHDGEVIIAVYVSSCASKLNS
jgi:hypothetical protein